VQTFKHIQLYNAHFRLEQIIERHPDPDTLLDFVTDLLHAVADGIEGKGREVRHRVITQRPPEVDPEPDLRCRH
jgi:hypothetical protein